MLKWILVGLVVFVIYTLIRGRPRYQRIFSEPHVSEIARGLAQVKDAAIARMDQEPSADPFADGTAFSTSAGILVYYTVAKESSTQIEHHVSLSYRGGQFAAAAAGYLAGLISILLDVRHARCVLALSSSGVYHFLFTLSKENHDRLTARQVHQPGADEARGLIDQAMQERDKLIRRMGRIDMKEARASQASRGSR